MKKHLMILILIMVFLVTGCTNLNNMDYDDLAMEILKTNNDLTNQYKNGYKYYVPRGLSVIDKSDYNEVISSSQYKYYLYVDVVSCYNNVQEDYIENSKAYFSKALYYGDNYGYLEINVKKNKYLIEIMYNYAKIEVMVGKRDIRSSLINAMTILSSIEYNKNIINSLMGEDKLNYKEVELDIFKTKSEDSNFIDYVKEYDNYEESDTEIPDMDLIN